MALTIHEIAPYTTRVWHEGDGPPLLYLHGFEHHPGDAAFLRRLAGDRAVHAPECPGYGESRGGERVDDPLDLVLFYRELVRSWGVERIDVVGHCLGGMLAAELAAACPDLVRRLVLVSSFGLWLEDAPPADPFALVGDALRAAKWHDPAAAPDPEPSIFEPDPDDRNLFAVVRNQNLSMASKFLWPIPDRGLRKRLPYVRSSTLIVHGASDGLVPVAHADELGRLIAGATVVVLPEAGHLPMLEQEDAFCEAVLGFLAS